MRIRKRPWLINGTVAIQATSHSKAIFIARLTRQATDIYSCCLVESAERWRRAAVRAYNANQHLFPAN